VLFTTAQCSDCQFFFAADSYHYTQNRCGLLRFVNFFRFGKLPLVVFWREHLNRPGKKQISGFGLPSIAVTKIKYKNSIDLQHEHIRL